MPPILSILVIDDDGAILRLVVNLLTAAGFKVRAVSTGKEGLNLARSERPDLVFTDMNMPGMGGAMIVSILRNDPALKETPIVLISGIPLSELESKMLEVGADAILGKPFGFRELVECARRWAKKSRHE